ncbi:MAG TPA: GNAT family N-acetyltransferase [Accumulibacter sp.]|uniref:GNAT family N-acetyltransferase n=1 Tax=Accumulibacter sp. TaxID=2053492 RepID=UPI002CCB507D|nr:GNAT family N-acetyltransferase [Accumulibacter sp.]HRF74675.1 GNAT family N-acetyltransferase [Accumulibacter sp.]
MKPVERTSPRHPPMRQFPVQDGELVVGGLPLRRGWDMTLAATGAGAMPKLRETVLARPVIPHLKDTTAMSTSPRLAWTNLPASALRQRPDLLAAWDRLNGERGDLPFLTAEAMICALDIFGDGSERLLVGQHGRTAVAMLILVPAGKFRWYTFQPSQIPLGACVAEAGLSLSNIARELSRGPLGFCLSLSMTQLDPRFSPRDEDYADSNSSDYIETGWIELNDSFDGYWSARGKNLRQNMRKQRNRLATEGITGWMRSLTARADMALAVERYGALESSGWKAAQGTAIHRDNAQGRFYRRLLEGAAERGEAVVYEYPFNDCVVASNLCLRRRGTLVVLKTTYNELIQSYSPAFLLCHDEMQQLYRENTIDRLEYYGRIMNWHTRWTENKRTIYHLTVYRWPLVKQFAEWRRRTSVAAAARPGTLPTVQDALDRTPLANAFLVDTADGERPLPGLSQP